MLILGLQNPGQYGKNKSLFALKDEIIDEAVSLVSSQIYSS